MSETAQKSSASSKAGKTELQPKKDPTLFLILWLAVPMALMIAYAAFGPR